MHICFKVSMPLDFSCLPTLATSARQKRKKVLVSTKYSIVPKSTDRRTISKVEFRERHLDAIVIGTAGLGYLSESQC